MTSDDYLGLLRDLLKVVGGVLVTHGAITEGNYELVAGVAIAAFPVAWSFVVRWQNRAAITTAAATGVPVIPGIASPTSAAPADIATVKANAGARA